MATDWPDPTRGIYTDATIGILVLIVIVFLANWNFGKLKVGLSYLIWSKWASSIMVNVRIPKQFKQSLQCGWWRETNVNVIESIDWSSYKLQSCRTDVKQTASIQSCVICNANMPTWQSKHHLHAKRYKIQMVRRIFTSTVLYTLFTFSVSRYIQQNCDHNTLYSWWR